MTTRPSSASCSVVGRLTRALGFLVAALCDWVFQMAFARLLDSRFV